MENLKIKNINGDGYELGLKFSKLFNSNFKNKFNYYKNLLNDKKIKNNFEKVKKKLEYKYPNYLQETYGRADGFNITRDEYLLSICFELYSLRESCTDIIIKIDNKHIISGHNEDLEENLEELMFVKYNNKNGYFCELSTYNCPQGTTFGWNDKGIIYSVNSIELKNNNEIGIPVWFILRDIVNCSNIEEIINKIDVNDCASAFSLNIIDSNNNNAYSIEKVLNKLDVISIDNKYIHTNHIIHPNIDNRLCVSSKSSLIRINTGINQLNHINLKNTNIEDVRKILRYSKNSKEFIYRNIGEDEYPTVATFLFDSMNKEIQIYSYYDKKYIKINI